MASQERQPPPSAGSGSSELPGWLALLDEAPDKQGPASGVPYAFFVGWGAISAMALGSGVLVGYRSFEGSMAYEALDKLEKPTPASEAQASRMAVRAFGWGTLLACGSAAAVVAAARRCPATTPATARRWPRARRRWRRASSTPSPRAARHTP